jgi:hypothetical protein
MTSRVESLERGDGERLLERPDALLLVEVELPVVVRDTDG